MVNNLKIYLFIFLLLILKLFSTPSIEEAKAYSYLENRGELYIRFYVDNDINFNDVFQTVSFDKSDGNEIYAYVYPDRFEKFLEFNLLYEVLTPPGLLITEATMSDFSDFDPKDEEPLDEYPTYEGYLKIMNDYAKEYPNICKLDTIGQSVKDRQLLVLKISDNVNIKEVEPTFFQTGTMHGDETFGWILMLNTINYLLTNYGKVDRATRIVDSMELWISPLSNPDGTYRNGNNTVKGATRANANSVDLNRNYPDPVRGEHPDGKEWQKETVNYMEFVKMHNFSMTGDYHGGTEVVFWPWSCKRDKSPDDDWFEMVARQYADIAHDNSPSGYLTSIGDGAAKLCPGWPSSPIYGLRIDWQLYTQRCRSFCLELNLTKNLDASKLVPHWNYNKEAELTFLEEIFYGVHGTVLDSLNGHIPVKAKVFVENHDDDKSHVYSDSINGDFYRHIIKGTYDFTFSADDYFTKTIKDIEVTNKEKTVLNVILEPKFIGISKIPVKEKNENINIEFKNNRLLISFLNETEKTKITIFDILGKEIITLNNSNFINRKNILWNGFNKNGNMISPGFYIINIKTPNKVITGNFIFTN